MQHCSSLNDLREKSIGKAEEEIGTLKRKEGRKERKKWESKNE